MGPQHIWEIEDLGNGKCTIKNVEADAFLDVQACGSGGVWIAVLSTTTTAPQWDVKKIGDFAYSITVKPRESTNASSESSRLALTLKNKDITLKPSNGSQNQLWYIEPTDGNFDQPQTQSEDDSHREPERQFPPDPEGDAESDAEAEYERRQAEAERQADQQSGVPPRASASTSAHAPTSGARNCRLLAGRIVLTTLRERFLRLYG